MSEENDGMKVDTDLIRQLADLLTEKDLSEIEVEDGDRKVTVKRNTTAAMIAQAMSAQHGQAAPQGAAPIPVPPPPSAVPPQSAETAAAGEAVKSPMVGTVYLSPEPGASAFVSPGARVREGDTLVIIEAMKVMNPIPAPRAGTVKQVCVQDSQPVEFDQALVILE
jgi:acetyl-CoA carboxylase biotin carboxyl carrier protein